MRFNEFHFDWCRCFQQRNLSGAGRQGGHTPKLLLNPRSTGIATRCSIEKTVLVAVKELAETTPDGFEQVNRRFLFSLQKVA